MLGSAVDGFAGVEVQGVHRLLDDVGLLGTAEVEPELLAHHLASDRGGFFLGFVDQTLRLGGYAGDFGVDLRIEREGGKAQVTKPRTALKGAGFTECVIGVFEKIDFRKPKGGTTVVSYSIRFTPR